MYLGRYLFDFFNIYVFECLIYKVQVFSKLCTVLKHDELDDSKKFFIISLELSYFHGTSEVSNMFQFTTFQHVLMSI